MHIPKTIDNDLVGNDHAPGSPSAARFVAQAYAGANLANAALADLLCEQIKSQLKIKRVRGDTFGYLQRSFLGCVSDVDQREAREVGERAVQFALGPGAAERDTSHGSVAIRRVGDYATDIVLQPIAAVAGKTRVMEDHLINAEGNGVTPAFHAYLRPLLGSAMPEAHRLRPAPVARLLAQGRKA